ncbi:SGS domain-containing protein [Chaetomium sp. MPI-CAGE-AT-0009]|nr:SGS domain-containing protein [Chaetomium sp. MPI-CAGE-AT-0009]
MSTTHGHKGVEAVQNKDYAAAIPLLDKALESSTSPAWLLARAQAHQQLKNYDEGLRDVELAYHAAAERGSGNSRKQMIESQYRRSVLYYKLGRYADADCCAKWCMLLAEGRPAREADGVEKAVDGNGNYTVTYEDGVADKKGQPGQSGDAKGNLLSGIMGGDGGNGSSAKTGFENDWKRAYTWRSQVLGALNKLPEDHAGRKVNVTKIPNKPQAKSTKPEPKPEPKVESIKPPAPAPGSVPDEQLKLKVDFYQSNDKVSVTLYVKDVKKEELEVEFSETQVRLSPLPRAAAPYVKAGDREAASTLTLDGKIDPSKSRFTAHPRKIELVLAKAAPGIKWGLWGKEHIGLDAWKNDTTAASDATGPSAPAPVAEANPQDQSSSIPEPTPKATTSAAPVYPTSSRSGPKNWDKLVNSEADGEDDAGAQDPNYFFKQLYKGATPEQQRAMQKSFIESNGTALSTDWNDVKSRTVETLPPDGVEAKKWE